MTSIGVSQIVSFIFRRLLWSLDIVRSDKIYVREHHFYDHQSRFTKADGKGKWI
jgi:hypothetical protein